MSEWIMIESRPMDEEERQYYSEHYGFGLTDDEAIIFCSQLNEKRIRRMRLHTELHAIKPRKRGYHRSGG